MYFRPNMGILPLRSIDDDWEKGRLDRHNRETIENSDTANYHVIVFSHPDQLFPLLQLLKISTQIFKDPAEQNYTCILFTNDTIIILFNVPFFK